MLSNGYTVIAFSSKSRLPTAYPHVVTMDSVAAADGKGGLGPCRLLRSCPNGTLDAHADAPRVPSAPVAIILDDAFS